MPIVLSPEEAVRLVESAPSPFYRALFCCLYSLGLRISEARGMTWADVDLVNGAVRVTQKGGGQKILPVGEWLKGCLEALPRGEKADPVFQNVRTGKQFYNPYKALEKARTAAKIEKRVTPHLLRHSMATHMIGQNISLRVVQRYLGHQQSTTTEFYTHVSTGFLRDAAETVLSGAVTKGKSGMVEKPGSGEIVTMRKAGRPRR